MYEDAPLQAHPRALLVVEPRFASEHVGVRRVVANYWSRLLELGYSVDLAVVVDGVLRAVSFEATVQSYRMITATSRGLSSPAWRSGQSEGRRRSVRRDASVLTENEPAMDLRATSLGRCEAESYDVSIITNPWLCGQRMPRATFTHGIVYDLVPNLLVAQSLDFGLPTYDYAHFSHSHHRGYQFYLESVRTILCISESTKSDFLRFYEPDDPRSVVVDVPFDMHQFMGLESSAMKIPLRHRQNPRVLLVNVLDPRKNIVQVTRALASVSVDAQLSIDVVGRERVAPERARTYLKTLDDSGADVTWHRSASDELLIRLYRAADVLLFPSLYEGLGLPVLEAQALGTPAISGSASSLGEINFNRSLFVDPQDAADISETVTGVLDGTARFERGATLTQRVELFLADNHRFEATLTV